MTDANVASLLGNSGPQPASQSQTPPPEPQPTPAAQPEQEPAAGGEEQRVPYDRFKQVNDQLKASTTELEELRKWRDEQEAAKLSEIEKAQRVAEQATQRATEAEQKALRLERTGWVVAAARDAGFADPGDAALAVDLAAVESAEQATQAVQKLATDKPHWIGQAQPQRPSGFGTITQTPTNEKGEPDPKAGLGQELMRNLFGGR